MNWMNQCNFCNLCVTWCNLMRLQSPVSMGSVDLLSCNFVTFVTLISDKCKELDVNGQREGIFDVLISSF